MKSKLLFCSFLFVVALKIGSAQDSLTKKNSLIGFPLAFYLPETRWGIGASGYYNFYLYKKDSLSPPSQIQLNVAYTQNRQYGIALPFQLFWNGRKHNVAGEIGLYNLRYLYFGFGDDNREGRAENYAANHLQFRLNYLRKIKPHIFIGARWWHDDLKVTDWTNIQPDPMLNKALGGFGSIATGPSLVALLDTRDNIYFSFSGHYLELSIQQQHKIWGSDFSHYRYRIDYRNFMQIRKQQAIALQAFGDFVVGDVPFNIAPNVGSSKRMRGLYEGRFRDKNLLLFQTEYRSYFCKKVGAVAFFNYAILSNQISEMTLSNDHASAGVGLRYALDKEKRVNLRVDAAWPVGVGRYTNKSLAGQTVIYFTVGEAF